MGDRFVFIVLGHFVADWMFQPYRQAITKAIDWRARAKHVFVYTLLMAFVLGLTLGPDPVALATMLLWVYASHFAIDTYRPVYWWMKYVHQDPGCQTWEDYGKNFSTIRGFAVAVVLDQIFHLLTLVPLLYWPV